VIAPAPITITIPIRLVNPLNQRRHWRAVARTAKANRQAAYLCVGLRLRELPIAVARFAPLVPQVFSAKRKRVAQTVVLLAPIVVTITRIAPSSGLDSDNLGASAKPARDGIADALGRDDRDPLITWEYAQERGKPREYAVRIEVRPAGVKGAISR